MTDNQKTYTVERLSISNIADLAVLHNEVYGRETAAGFFQKKYDTVYTGAKFIGFIAYNLKHLPIAFYGVIPTLLSYNGRTILAAQSVDSMTHPDYRKIGLFTELANHTYELCRLENIRLIFGFPNQNSLPGLMNKLGWHTEEYMERFEVPVSRMINLESIANKFPLLKPYYQRYQKWVLKDYLKSQSGVKNSVLTDGFNGVYRDDNYLKYKSFSGPTIIQIDDTLFWLKLQNGLHIGDIENLPDNFIPVIKKLKVLARKLGIRQIYLQASPQTRLHKLFAQYHQPITSYATGFKDLEEGLPTADIKFTFADIDIF